MNTPYRQHALAVIYFTGIILAMTYPLVRVFSTHFIGDAFSDAYEYSRHIWWMNRALYTGEPVFFQPLLAYPDGLDGAWLWGNPLQSFPAWLFAYVMPLPAAYNLSAVINLSLNGFAMYLLTWQLTRNLLPALLGGTVFALYPTIQGHLIASHVGLVTLWGIPLYVLMLLQLKSPVNWRVIALAALFFVLSLLGNSLLLVYVLFPVTLIFALARLVRREWAWLVRILASAAIGGAVSLVFIAPIALEQVNSTLVDEGGDVLYSADLLAVVAPSFYNPLFSDLTYSREILGEIKNIEGTAYVGVVAGWLCLLAIARMRESRLYGWLALLAWVLSLGPLLKVADELVTLETDGYLSHVVLPWSVLMNLPVLNIARTPARFNFAVGVAVAIMAAYGFQWLIARLPNRAAAWGVFAVVVFAIGFEYQVMWQNGRPHLHTTIDLQAGAITALHDDDSIRAVFNIPYDHLLVEKDGMYLQTRHTKPLIGGHVTRRTPVDPAKLQLMQHTLDPYLLDEAGADVIILHRRWAEDDLETHARERLGAPFHEDDLLLAWYTPQVTGETEYAQFTSTEDDVDEPVASYVYTQGPRWVTLDGAVNGEASLSLGINGAVVHQWQVAGETGTTAPVWLPAGYNTLTLSTDMTCLTLPDEAVACKTVALDTLTITPAEVTSPVEAVQFAEGIRLDSYRVNDDDVWLAWTFAEPLPENVVRFVHVLDESGGLVAQSDVPFDAEVVGGQWMEAVPVSTGDLRAGDYDVYLGWYTLPDVVRVPVFSAVGVAQNGWVKLATVSVPDA
ncbi:MAG: hypothetical protein AAF787_04125 [Chloroflexota bacterium]